MKINFQSFALAFYAAFAFPAALFSQIPSTPDIHLCTTADSLLLRAKPDKNAAVTAILRTNTQLVYLHETSVTAESAANRGVAGNTPWYKVALLNNTAQTGWIYGGALAVSSVSLPDGVSPAKIKEAFLDIQSVSKTDFEQEQRAAGKSLKADILEHRISNDAFQLAFENGTQRVIRDTLSRQYDGGPVVDYTYHGQLADIGQYIVEVNNNKSSVILFIDRKNGMVSKSLGFPIGLPALSPDSRWITLGYLDTYEVTGGLQVLRTEYAGVSPAFNLQQHGFYAKERFWSATSGVLYFSWNPMLSADKEAVPQYFRMNILMP